MVLATLVVNTIIGKGPIVFMKLAQEDSGEIDGIFIAGNGTYSPDSNSYWNDGSALNYTLATQLLQENEIEHHLSPRYEICPVDFKDTDGNDLAPPDTMCLKFIDTDQEREIGVGVMWPYEKLQLGECLISSDF